MLKFMNNVKFGQTVKQGKESYKFYLGENCYSVYKPLSGKANEHRISNSGQVYSIENCLLDYFGASLDIVNDSGEHVFQQKYKVGDQFHMKCGVYTEDTYTIVYNEDKEKYGMMNSNYTVFSCNFDSVEELVKQEFPSKSWIKKELS